MIAAANERVLPSLLYVNPRESEMKSQLANVVGK